MVDLTQPTLASSVPGKEGANAPRALISVYDKTGVTAFATTVAAAHSTTIALAATALASGGGQRRHRARRGRRLWCRWRGAAARPIPPPLQEEPLPLFFLDVGLPKAVTKESATSTSSQAA